MVTARRVHGLHLIWSSKSSVTLCCCDTFPLAPSQIALVRTASAFLQDGMPSTDCPENVVAPTVGSSLSCRHLLNAQLITAPWVGVQVT